MDWAASVGPGDCETVGNGETAAAAAAGGGDDD